MFPEGLHQNVLLQSPNLRLTEIASLQLIQIQANGEVPSKIYRKALSLAVTVAAEKRLLYWLVNNKISGTITPADQIWSNEVIAPRIAQETIIRKMAFIEPEDVLSGIILENMMDEARDIFPFEMQFFHKPGNAIRWFLDSSDMNLEFNS